MDLYRFGNTYIPENQIRRISIEVSGRDPSTWKDTYSVVLYTADGSSFPLPSAPLETCQLLLKTSFSANVKNVSSEGSIDDEYLQGYRR